MVRISEANLSSAMTYTFDRLIKPRDREEILAYAPKPQDDKTWLKDNPTTGLIYLDKYPNAKEAWVLVKFEFTQKNKNRVATTAPTKHATLHNPQEFEDFFGVAPVNYPDDMIVIAHWDKQQTTRAVPRDFDETAPNFYMYVNHSKASLDVVVKRLYRINEIIEATGTTGNLFKIPYSATNAKF